MKPWIPVAVGGLVVLLSFQNCSAPHSEQSLNQVNPPTQKIDELILSEAESIHINPNELGQEAFLDLSSGRVTKMDRQTGMSEARCLSEAMVAAIQDVLHSSQVCEPVEPAQNSQVVCAQVYTMPYARINWIDKQVELLGEAKSSCQKGADLCENRGPILKSLLNEVLNRWDEWSCDFKVVSL